MNSNFFAKPRLGKLPTALWILMGVFFAVPFTLRGARDALERLENNVADWLPSSFEETTQLSWFADHFAGEQFALITWDGCTEDDQSFQHLQRVASSLEFPS